MCRSTKESLIFSHSAAWKNPFKFRCFKVRFDFPGDVNAQLDANRFTVTEFVDLLGQFDFYGTNNMLTYGKSCLDNIFSNFMPYN